MSASPRHVDDLPAIDVHGHYGAYLCPTTFPLKRKFMSATAAEVAVYAASAKTEWTIVSPLRGLLPRHGADAAAGNREANRLVPKTPGLLQWVILNPLQPETYRQVEARRTHPTFVGIKIHPEEHGYPIRRHGRKIFEFAAKHGLVILTHSGEQNSLPADFIPFANDFPEVKLILAHLGCGWDGDPTHQVRAIQSSKRGNVFVDTSSAQSIMPKIIEWGVAQLGAGRILYGTDTPLYSPPMQRARIDRASITAREKRLILRENALRLFSPPSPAAQPAR